ncbi:MAG: PAS domain S-box protein [Chitinophagaceae bacterium]|nr:PAS domain S-box protein [Chitinophagaceae bacterium]
MAEAQLLAKLGSWNFDINTGGLTWSDELYHVFGTDKQTFTETHHSFTELVDKADRDFVLLTSKHAQETGKPFNIEYHITTPNGEKRVIHEKGYSESDASGKITRLFGTAQDITERKLADQALQEAYTERNTILERIDDGFFAIDKNSIVTYWNKRAEILLHKKKEDIIGKNLHEVFASSGSSKFYVHYQNAIKNNTSMHFEEFSDMSNKWLSVCVFASENGLSVYFKDITAQKIATEKLKKSETQYRSLIEQATDAICIADASFKFIDVNASGCSMFRIYKIRIPAALLFDVLFKEDLEFSSQN